MKAVDRTVLYFHLVLSTTVLRQDGFIYPGCAKAFKMFKISVLNSVSLGSSEMFDFFYILLRLGHFNCQGLKQPLLQNFSNKCWLFLAERSLVSIYLSKCCIFSVKNKVKSCICSKWSIRQELISVSLMKRFAVFLLPLAGWDASSPQGYTSI